MDFGVHHLPLPGGAPAPKIGGSLPPLPPPPVWRHDAPCEGVDTRCRRPTGLYPIGFGQSVQPASNAGFRAQPGPQRRGAAPSESGALGLLKGRATSCATYVRHPPFVSGPPIRRHVLDPRRRKSSIISRPLEAAMAFDAGPITSAPLTSVAEAPQPLAYCRRQPHGKGSPPCRPARLCNHRPGQKRQILGHDHCRVRRAGPGPPPGPHPETRSMSVDSPRYTSPQLVT